MQLRFAESRAAAPIAVPGLSVIVPGVSSKYSSNLRIISASSISPGGDSPARVPRRGGVQSGPFVPVRPITAVPGAKNRPPRGRGRRTRRAPGPVDPKRRFWARPGRYYAKIYIVKYYDFRDGEAKRHTRAPAGRSPRAEGRVRAVQEAGHRDGEEAQRGARAARLRARGGKGGARQHDRRVRHEKDEARERGRRGRARARRAEGEARPAPRSHPVGHARRGQGRRGQVLRGGAEANRAGRDPVRDGERHRRVRHRRHRQLALRQGLKEYAGKSRPRAGTPAAASHALLRGIGDANIMLAARQFPGGDKLAGCTRSMLASAARHGVMPKRLLADRGFFNADCMPFAGKGGRNWITPVPKNERIKRRTREHREGTLSGLNATPGELGSSAAQGSTAREGCRGPRHTRCSTPPAGARRSPRSC